MPSYASAYAAAQHLSVCPSVTIRYCTKMAKRKTLQTMQYNSTGTTFLKSNIVVKFKPGRTNRGAKS